MNWNYFLPEDALAMARHRISYPTTPIPNSNSNLAEAVPSDALLQLSNQTQACQSCKLSRSRTRAVFGEGNPQAKLLFLGESPGEVEDQSGRPFVGEAGALLNKMIEAMGVTRDQVYLANVVKCRPPADRYPEPDEMVACDSFLTKQIEAIQPQVIVALGRCAAQSLLKLDTPLSQIRGQFQVVNGMKVMPTFHPSYLLTNPDAKKVVWSDLKQVMAELGWPEKSRGGK